MGTYSVKFVETVYMRVTIEADNEAAAIEAAKEHYSEGGKCMEDGSELNDFTATEKKEST